MTAGVTISAEHPTRRALAASNLPLFETVARTCVARLPDAVFIVVHKPVACSIAIQQDSFTAPSRHLV